MHQSVPECLALRNVRATATCTVVEGHRPFARLGESSTKVAPVIAVRRRTLAALIVALPLCAMLVGSATTAGAQTARRATITLANVAILPGQDFLGSIVSNDPITSVTSVTVSGPCVASGPVADTDPAAPGIQFRISTLPQSPAGTCRLTFVVTFRDNTTETGTADITLAPGTASVGMVVTQSVSGLGAAPVNIQLFDCGSVNNLNGVITFNGTRPNQSANFAILGTNTAVITMVNGTATGTSSNQVNGVMPANGTVTISFTDLSPGECVIPVAFQRGTGPTADQLPLSGDNRPLVPFSIGAPVTFLPPAASAGPIGTGLIPTARIIAVAPPYFVVTSAGTYIQQERDVINIYISATGTCRLAPRTPGTGHRRLTPGDLFGGFYDPNGVSTFCLADIAPLPPTTATATQGAAGTVVNFILPASTESDLEITGFNIYRALATPPATSGAPYTCPISTPVPPGASPQTPPPAPYTLVGEVPATAAGSYSFNDSSASPGSNPDAPNAFCYAVASLAVNEDGGLQEGTARPANATNPPPGTSGSASATTPAPEVPARLGTVTAVVSSANPSGLGEAVTLTATVTSPAGAPPGGTVQFKDGGTNLGPPLPLTGDTASITLSGLSVGSHTITAVYSGSGAFGPSISAPLNQVVGATIPCDHTITGDVSPQTLGPGRWCIVNARLLGLIIRPGASVSISNSKIVGPFSSTGATYLRLCGSQVARGLTVSGSIGFVLIGDPARDCAGNDISGSVDVSGNTGGLDLSADRISRSLTVNDNRSSPTTGTGPGIAANVVIGSLSCTGNVPPPTNRGQANTASAKVGQCSSL